MTREEALERIERIGKLLRADALRIAESQQSDAVKAGHALKCLHDASDKLAVLYNYIDREKE